MYWYNTYPKYKMAIHINGTGYRDDGIDWSKYAGAKRLFEINSMNDTRGI